jgi:zinc transporter ZupT
MRRVEARRTFRSAVELLVVTAAALATAVATGAGALPFLFARHPDRRWLGAANSLAAGLMVGASVGLLYEGAEHGVARTGLGAGAGAVVLVLSGWVIERRSEAHLGSLDGLDARRALLIVGVMTVHSFAEGVGVGVAFGGEEALGILIAAAIAIHNIPEGLAISLVLVPRGVSVRGAAGWSIFSSLPQPFMAVPAFLFVEEFTGFLPIGLGFAAGAMLSLVAVDLVPEALESRGVWVVTSTIVASATAMLAFLLLLL